MRPRILPLAALTTLCAVMGCGTPGVPQPPSLQLPKRVEDLRAVRKGNSVFLSWTAPRQTTDGQLIKSLGPTRICRSTASLGAAPPTDCREVGQLALPAARQVAGAAPDDRKEWVDQLPSLDQSSPDQVATYAVEVPNAGGNSAGLSNQAVVPMAPVPQQVRNLTAQISAEGVRLQWDAPIFSGPHTYRIRRRIAARNDQDAVVIGECCAGQERGAFSDSKIAWETHYLYSVTPVAILDPPLSGVNEVEGVAVATTDVFAHDTFAPEAPTGLQAVFSPAAPPQPGSIDLTWMPSSAADLAGYNVYRSEPAGAAAWVKITAEMVKTPAYRDRQVRSGAKYQYRVTAVDLRGNESSPSPAASEGVPQP